MISSTLSSLTERRKRWPPSLPTASNLNSHVYTKWDQFVWWFYNISIHFNFSRYLRFGHVFTRRGRVPVPHLFGRVGAAFRSVASVSSHLPQSARLSRVPASQTYVQISADNDRLILTSRQIVSNLFWPITFSLLFWVDGLSYPIRGGWQSLMARRQLSTRPSSHRNVNGLWTCSLETCTPRSWRNIAG